MLPAGKDETFPKACKYAKLSACSELAVNIPLHCSCKVPTVFDLMVYVASVGRHGAGHALECLLLAVRSSSVGNVKKECPNPKKGQHNTTLELQPRKGSECNLYRQHSDIDTIFMSVLVNHDTISHACTAYPIFSCSNFPNLPS